MPTLHEIQAVFLQDIYTGEKLSEAYLNKSCSAKRLDIFYNNTYLTLTDILAEAYPVLQKIVGDKFFRTIAHFYIEKYHQRNGNRHSYGREFASFLTSYQPAVKWPYLSEIAKIEWAYFQSMIADDEQAINFNKITDLISEYPNFVLFLHPGVFLIELNYNSLEIWHEHQKDKIETIELQEIPQTVLIWRDQNDEIIFQKITEPLKKLFLALQKGNTFTNAMFHASEGLQDLTNFQQEFARIVSSGVFVYKGDRK